MGVKEYLIFLSAFAVSVQNSHGCQMEGITNWNFPVTVGVLDVFRGEVLGRSTQDIIGITNVAFTQDLNGGPYLNVLHTGSQFSIQTNNAYEDYEENETNSRIGVTVTFSCSGGNTNSLVFLVDVQDTNNNDPLFRPDNVYELMVTPPLPPGYRITGCWENIFTRDIDLTTQRVDFQIYDSPNFEIVYNDESSTVPKEFQAMLRTTTFIRSIPEPIEFQISATDVDLTGDPRRTTTATVRIISDGEFELPDEPVFSQTFYLATYTENHQVVLQDTITLTQGYHEDVQFSLTEYSQYFTTVRNGNEISIQTITQLPVELLRQEQILLVVRAERSFTSGASATIVVRLPEGRVLGFSQAWYIGQIADGSLSIPPLTVIGGENLALQLSATGEFASYFSLGQESNNVVITMSTPLPDEIIENNAFLLLDIEAAYPEAVSGLTTAIIELVTEPIIHPVFDQAFYIGQYSSERGLVFEQTIQLAQGYDGTVSFALDGDDSEAFELIRNSANSYTLSLRGNEVPNMNNRHQLVFSVVATKPDSTPGRAAIVITLTGAIISFSQASYAGQIIEGALDLSPLTLTRGYELPVQFRATGEFASYFTLARESNDVIVTLTTPLPQQVIDENSVFMLDIEAYYPDAVSGFTAVVLELVKEPIVPPVFDQAYYAGEYSIDGGLVFQQTIQLAQGYDGTVSFDLEGDDATAFSLNPSGPNSFTLSVNQNAIVNPAETHQIIFSVVATKPDSVPGRAAIVIALTDLPEPLIISFAQASYVGQIIDNSLNVPTVTVVEGYDLTLQLSPRGEFASYFTLARESNNVIISMNTALPEEIIENNAFIPLDVEASYPDAVSGFTTVILELVKEPIVHPVFEQAYYAGEYSIAGGLVFEQTIQLAQGFDGTVSFDLEGDDASAFSLNPSAPNSFTLSVNQNAIVNPAETHQLIFSVVATKPDSVPGRAAIVIALTDLPEPLIISFAQASYVGQIIDNSLNLPTVTVVEGYDLALQLNPRGEFASYFTLARESNNVIISMNTALPEEIIENNAFIPLDVEASYPDAVSGFTTVILELVREPIVHPVFDQAYYSGEYSNAGGLVFEQTIQLMQGYDETVEFDLEGDDAQAFSLSSIAQNSFTLIVNQNEIGDLTERSNLLFSVVATKPDSITARSAIIISLTDVPDPTVISFSLASYVGQINDSSLDLQPLVVTAGYDLPIQLNVVGEYASYFTLTQNSNNIIVIMNNPLPPDVVQDNFFIILDVEASHVEAVSGFTTIILELVREPEDPIITPVFDQAYYIGEYSNESGLQFDHTIQLIQGFDDTVSFTLSGEGSQAFNLVETGHNRWTLTLNGNELENLDEMQKLVFSVIATKPDSVAGQTAIIIALTGMTSHRSLQFNRITYTGSVEGVTVNLEPIVLSEGYAPGVMFNLHGELQNYFELDTAGATVTLVLLQPVPQDAIPSNGIILLNIEASAAQAASAFATIVLEIDTGDDPSSLPDPVFAEAFYVGTFSSNDGLIFDDTISLAEGYDASIVFGLEAEHSQWFALEQSDNSVRVILSASNPIPPAVIANNQQLLFVVTAQRPGGAIARTTVVIVLSDEVTSDRVLGFNRVSYVGSIVEDAVNLEPIVLSEGYAPGVMFTLHGELQNYFELDTAGATVTLVLLQPVPQDAIPSNGIILLNIEASAAQAASAFATIVLEVETGDEPSSLPDPVFAEAFYVGTFSSNVGLIFEDTISLAEGYDASIVFGLEAEHSQWFALDYTGNNVRVILSASNPIPPAVIANNQQLLFVVTAQRPGGAIARSTVVIVLSDEVTSDRVLGFNRVSYVGSIVEDAVNLEPIVLSEGYAPGVMFTLHGELQNYFELDPAGATVTLVLLQPVPQDAIPSNGIILLNIEASAAQAASAFATIVLEVETGDAPSSLPDPVFAEAFYVGTFSSNVGLIFEDTISLAEGYDASIVFGLEAEHSQWFALDYTGNNVRVILSASNPIPPAVIANNQQLLFVVTAQRPGGAIARSTVVIVLSDEVTSDRVLGFNRVSYVGSIVGDAVNLEPIVLSEGYAPGVMFTLHGELQNYFELDPAGATVTLVLLQPVPQDAIPSNGIILLNIEASAAQAASAFATIVLEVETGDEPSSLPDPVFAEAFYVGTFSSNVGLIFEDTISLAEGYDASIVFGLEAEHSQWFALDYTGNNVRVILSASNPIPPAVIANNQQLLFVVTAQRPGGAIARSTVVIVLSDEVTSDRVLGFNRVSYVGSIVEDAVNLEPIVLSEGYAPGVMFTLHGELQNYFELDTAGATVTLVLLQPVPQDAIPSNGIILLNIEASAAQAASAFATIVLEVETGDAPSSLPDPVFAEAFYVGTFSSNVGLIFEDTISLAEGYDASIVFGLEAEHSQWFALDYTGNNVRVILSASNPIPPAVIANNQQLLFVVTAQRPGGAIARSTVVIVLSDEVTSDRVLGFNRVSYVGSIVEDAVNLEPIVLSEGYAPGVMFTLHGELQNYFELDPAGATVTLVLLQPVPQDAIPSNGIILLNIEASAAQAASAFATIVLEVETGDAPSSLPDPVFAEAFYVGTFSSNVGLIFEDTISLAEGYDASIVFGLEAEHSQWFALDYTGNNVRVILSASNPIPPAVIANNQQLLFVVTAQRPGGAIARSTVVIVLSDEVTSDRVLGFNRVSYVGSIVEDAVNLEPIVLSEGYAPGVMFTLHGELQNYFELDTAGATVTLVLLQPVPQDAIPSNGIILLNIEASAAQAASAFATIVLEVETGDAPSSLPDPVFAEAFYVGTFSSNVGLIFEDTISLAEGYDASIVFGLEAEHSQWFALEQSDNSVRVILSASNPIPPAVIANNQQLLFVVTAQRPGGAIARSTVVIVLSDEVTSDRVLGFNRVSYVGSIVEDAVNLEPIVLSEGYAPGVMFTLHGELQNYFELDPAGATVTLVLLQPVPQDAIPSNGIILLNIEASAAQAASAFATIVLEVETGDEPSSLPDPVFAEAFYVGTFSSNDGLIFDDTISLAEGYDASIAFGLEAEHSQWFALEQSDNSVRVILSASNPIPPAVIANNQQLLFVVTAQRPGGAIARTTVVIVLSDEVTSDQVLGFNQVSYVGSIVQGAVNLQPIVLSEGYAPGVSFNLHGELQNYFELDTAGATVTLVLLQPVPQDAIPSNGIILLNIEASAAQAASAFATIVLEVETGDAPSSLPDPVFAEAFYVGTFSSNVGLIFEDTISLAEGYDASIVFGLEAEHSQWFALEQSDNSVRVILSASNPIPPAVIANNQQLLFVVTAQRPGGAIARSTVVIVLSDEVTSDRVLGFNRVSYVGSIVEDAVNLEPIVLSEGYAPGVSFNLHGELQNYFELDTAGATVTLVLLQPVPQDAIPSNGIILLNIEASAAQAASAFATIVLEVETGDEPSSLPDPVFAEAFYVGTFSSNDGLIFDDTISLAEGYDASIAFGLEAEHSQWFALEQSDNSVRVILSASNPIPPAVIANNQQLLFVVTAQRPGGAIARTTVVIVLSDEVTSDQVLGFNQVSYVGSIVQGAVNLQPIVLSEGYAPGVSFNLHGELQNYFELDTAGATVTLVLLQPVPQDAIPSNGIILLNIEASAAQAASAFATIVLEVETGDEPSSLPDPVFAEAFYVGTFSSNDGLIFDDTISLAEGYDASIVFELEAEHSQWFALDYTGNNVRVILSASNPIPPAVIANNQQLLFVVTAQRPGGAIARTTVVIVLSDEVTSDRVLGFNQVSYVGSIVQGAVNLQPIVLSEGYAPGVSFNLHGELQNYFELDTAGATVTLVLLQPVPQDAIPSNGIILLNIEASAAQAASAFATIVLEVETGDEPSSLPDPVFAEAFYVGTFSSNDGLIFDDTISLAEGYDASIAFGLEAEHSQWFALEQSDNSVRVILSASNPIPPAVIANNQQLLFVVTAQRPGGAIARTTVVIVLSDEVTSDRVLGFNQVSYVGSIVQGAVNLEPIVLSEGYAPGVSFTLHGDLQNYFAVDAVDATVTLALLQPIPQDAIPSNGIILLNIEAHAAQAASAFATIVLEIDTGDDPSSLPDPVFAEAFYVGTFSSNDGLIFDDTISLAEGYDASIVFGLEAEHSQWFALEQSDNSVRVILSASNPVPPAVIANNQQLLFVVTAQRPGSSIARATIVILLTDEEITDPDLPPVEVLFDSSTYVVRVEMGQTGLVGQVSASASNGERIIYSLLTDDEHLRGRISINNMGELRLSAPVNSGVHSFQAVGTTAYSQATGMAAVSLSVDAVTVCGEDTVVPPLIVIDRDEEEPLRNLVLLNTTEHAGCRYNLSNRWPADQPWLYVDDTGLHATAIDREDPSIAFMALSQVQIELTLVCDSDVRRSKRSTSERLDWLGPYDYGTNTWLLGETILFNSKRSIVNLIVNDINDNTPTFIGKENEPVIVGYPVPDLEQLVLPRSLAELQATDADIGENAALVYWSSEPELAVSPTTGFVHVRNGQNLEQDQILTVNATDLNGQGLTGSINLMVKLLDSTNIAVITVRNSFLEDENRVLGNISNLIGYEVRTLRAVVISETEEDDVARTKREVIDTEASLEMYVYGLVSRQPVGVETLITDIGSITIETISIASVETLEDHLEGLVITDNSSSNNAGLLAATIVLSILLFLLIVAAVAWYIFRRWKKNQQDYDQFSDMISVGSQNDALSQPPKPFDATALSKPKLNIEELKRSERRLQDMLNMPVEEVPIEPSTSTSTFNAAVNPVEPLPAIVIQDKLKDAAEETDDDEFGEVKQAKRKSVVTFNENVEKIIHVAETPRSEPEIDVYKF